MPLARTKASSVERLSFAVEQFTRPATATGAAVRTRTLLPPLGRPGHHRMPEPVFHDVPAAAASGTGSETGVARHRNTVEHSISPRCDRACGAGQLDLF